MAYGLKYYGEVLSDRGTTIRAEILKQDYAGSTSALRLMEDPTIEPEGPEREYVYAPILRTKVEAVFLDRLRSLENDLLNAGATEFLLNIKEDGVLRATTIVAPLTDRRSLNLGDDLTYVAGRCGLEDLKDIPFVEDDDTFYSGTMKLRDIVMACLRKLPYTAEVRFAMNWYTPGIAATTDMMDVLYRSVEDLHDKDWHPLSCDEVIRIVLEACHLTLRQAHGRWEVKQPDVFFAGTHREFRYDGATGAFVSTNVVSPSVAVTESSISDDRKATPRQPIIQPLEAAVVTFQHGEPPPLIRNGSFGTRDEQEETPATLGGRGPTGGERSHRHFGGRYSRPPMVEIGANYWTNWDGTPLEPTEIHKKFPGPNGENTYRFDFVAENPSGGTLPDEWGKYFVQVETLGIRNDSGRLVRGGTDRRIEVAPATYISVPKGILGALLAKEWFVWWELRITSADGSMTRWLHWDGSWKTTKYIIPFGGGDAWSTTLGRYVGIGADRWNHHLVLSDDIPAGDWRVKARIYPAIYGKGGGPVPSHGDNGHYWTNIKPRLVIGSGVYPKSTIAIARQPVETRQKITREISTFLGEPPVLDMESGVLFSTGLPAGNFKLGAYAGEPDTEQSLTDILADALFTEQAEIINVHDAEYLRDVAYVWPDQVLEIDGVRYYVGNVRYHLRSGTFGGSFIRLRQYAGDIEYDALQEDGTFQSLGSGSDTQSYFAEATARIRAAVENALAVTTAVIADGASEAVPVMVSSLPVQNLATPIEAGDGLLLIGTDGQWIELTADENRATGATTVAIADHAFTEPLPFPAGIYPRTAEIKSLLIQTRDAFRVSIKAGAVGEVNGVLSGSVTAIPIKAPGTRYALKHGDRILVQHGTSGASTEAVVEASALPDDLLAAGATSIPLQSSTALSAPDGSPVHLSDVTLQSDIIQQAGEIALKVSKGEVISEINVSPEVVRIASNRIQIDGSTTFAAGYDPTDKNNTFRQATAPASGMTTGDLWIDSDDGDRIYTWNGSAWVEALTIINGGNIQTGTITASKLSVATLSAITANLGTVTAGIIQDTNGKFVINLANALLTVKDAQGTPVDRVRVGKLGAGAQDYGIEILNSAGSTIIGLTGLGVGTVGSGQIVDGAVLSTKIVDLAITEGKLADLAISLAKLQDSAVGSTKIAAGAVITSKLAAGAVTANEIAAGAITALKIAAGAIETDKLTAGAVTAAKISVGTLSAITADLGTVNAGTLNSVVINSPTINAGGGDVTIDDDGVALVAGTTSSNKVRWLNGGVEILSLYGHSAGTAWLEATGALSVRSDTSLNLFGLGGLAVVIDNVVKVPSGLPLALGERVGNPFGLGSYGQLFVKSNGLHFMRPDGTYGGLII